MLNVILPCCKGDQHQAVWLLEWIAQMGKVDTLLVILCADDCDTGKLISLGEQAFSRVKWLRDAENIKSDWRAEGWQAKSAAGPNSLFRQACWYFALNNLGPWFWLEPDAIACRADWLTLIDAEYQAAQKPFMGYLVNPATHPGKVATHMSGVGAYPENTPGFLQKSILGNSMAFDVMGAGVMVPNMKDTALIFHRYRPPGFETQEDFDARVSPQVAVWHSVKDGSIYPFLRNRLFGTTISAPPTTGVVQLAERPSPERNVEGSNPSSRAVWEFRNGNLVLAA